jgi:hypothetical protein
MDEVRDAPPRVTAAVPKLGVVMVMVNTHEDAQPTPDTDEMSSPSDATVRVKEVDWPPTVRVAWRS